MHWTRRHRDSWPAPPPPGRLDDAAERLVRIALLGRLAAVPLAFAYLGLGPYAGQPPRSVSDAAGGIPRSQAEMLRHRLRQVASAAGPPPQLRPAVELIDAALPASPGWLAALLTDAGLTSGVLHPLALRALARLWNSQPSWTVTARTRTSGRMLTGPLEQRSWLPTVAHEVRTAGAEATAKRDTVPVSVADSERPTNRYSTASATVSSAPTSLPAANPAPRMTPSMKKSTPVAASIPTGSPDWPRASRRRSARCRRRGRRT